MQRQLIQGFSHVYAIDKFENEFLSMFGKNKGEVKRYAIWLASMLEILDEKGMGALRYQQFEHLENTNGPTLYAIRHAHSKINDRYIYVYTNGEDSTLLTAFMEKDVSDYTHSIIRASNLYKELERGN
jgi:hypothetical protein